MKPDKAHNLFGRRDPDTGSDGHTNVDSEASGDAVVIERLQASLRRQADRVEPSPDAYARLAEAVYQRSTPRAPYLRFAATATAVLAVVGVAGLAISQIGSVPAELGQASSAGDSALVRPGPGAAETDDAAGSVAVGSGTPQASPGPTTSIGVSGDAAGKLPSSTRPVVGGGELARVIEPVSFGDDNLLVGDEALGRWGEEQSVGARSGASSRTAAARKFLALIGSSAIVDEAGADPGAPNSVGLLASDGSSPSSQASTLAVDRMDDGTYQVVGAVASTVDDVAVSATVDAEGLVDTLVIEGAADARRRSVTIDVMSATDDRVLASTSVAVESVSGTTGFSAALPVHGTERAWVVVRPGPEGVVDRDMAFTAVPVAYRAATGTASYTVIRIGPDDPDGGLRIHSAPGESSPTVGVLPTGSGGVVRTDQAPIYLDPWAWWEVRAVDGTVGWAHSAYLASEEPLSNARRLAAATALADGLNGSGDLAEVPMSRRVAIQVGTFEDPVQLSDRDEIHRWLNEYRPDDDLVGSLQVVDRVDGRLEASLFGTLTAAVVRSRGNPSDELVLYLEATPTGAEVVGVMLPPQTARSANPPPDSPTKVPDLTPDPTSPPTTAVSGS